MPEALPPRLVTKVMAARGGTAEQAQKWIDRRIAASSVPVRNEAAFIRGCLEKEAKAEKPTKVTKKPTVNKATKPATAEKAVEPTGDRCSQCGSRYRPGTAWGKRGFCESHYREWLSDEKKPAAIKPVKKAMPDPVGRTVCPRCTRPMRGTDRVVELVGRGRYHSACAEALAREAAPQSVTPRLRPDPLNSQSARAGRSWACGDCGSGGKANPDCPTCGVVETS